MSRSNEQEHDNRPEDDDEDDDVPPTLIEISADDTPITTSASTEAPHCIMRKEPCPLTILSGFLGSGKTTLIQYILQSPDHGKRIAVIENEYGGGGGEKESDEKEDTSTYSNSKSLRIESLIAQDGLALQDDSVKRNLLDMIELPNGCVCCTVKDKLVQTLEALLQARPDLDYILLECSGMANPGPLATTFWLDEALESQLRLDGIVTLVDAKYIGQQLDTTVEAAQQIAYADRILINKMDLVSHHHHHDSMMHTMKRIQQLNPLAEVRATKHSHVDLNWILDVHLFDPANHELVPNSPEESLPQEHAHSHHHSHDHSHDVDCQQCAAHAHGHTDAISTITLHHDGCVQSLDILNRWLAELLWPDQDGTVNHLSSHDISLTTTSSTTTQETNNMSILRLKGIVALPDQPEHYIVQAVYDTWQVLPAQTTTFVSDLDKACQLIVIGKHLNETRLRREFQAILRTPKLD